MTAEVLAAKGAWRSLHPQDAMKLFSSLHAPWWIAGGWALDLYLGRQSRPHEDLDIGVLRRDIERLRSQLPSWQIFEAKDGVLTRLHEGSAPRADVNSLWCRPVDQSDWTFELMLEGAQEDRWVFRREPTIQRQLSLVILRDPHGIPFLAPELQLLYKARSVRAKDQADFDVVVPRLDRPARDWLRNALMKVEPHHEWLRPNRL